MVSATEPSFLRRGAHMREIMRRRMEARATVAKYLARSRKTYRLELTGGLWCNTKTLKCREACEWAARIIGADPAAVMAVEYDILKACYVVLVTLAEPALLRNVESFIEATQ